MADSYITRTGAFLPGEAIDNDTMHRYLGKVLGEGRVREKILRMNGIQTRHYALDRQQKATHTVAEQAALAIKACLGSSSISPIDYLSTGTTFAPPLIAPGLASLLHDQLSQDGLIDAPLEINSNAGICSSGAQAIVNAARAVQAGDAQAALCVGTEQPSIILNSKAFRPTYDLLAMRRDLRTSKWFMAVFLRFMLSDGAGAFLLEPQPSAVGGHSKSTGRIPAHSPTKPHSVCSWTPTRPC